MRVFVTGASGLMGSSLCRELVKRGDEVVAISRKARSSGGGGIRWVVGDIAEAGDWQAEIANVDAVVHLAGESIADGRWTETRKQRLVASRVDSTRRVVEAMAAAGQPPRVLVNASATGYYGRRGEESLDEASSPGDDFLARLCQDWEAAALAAQSDATRVVCVRFSVVLSANGGALDNMLPPFKLGIGGPIGPKDRWFPWIHERDAVGLLLHALDRSEVEGPVNAVAPGVVRMGEFASTLGRVLSRPAFLPVPIAALRIALGEFADYLSPGQRVDSKRARETGYRFTYPELAEALQACVK